jgi:hypothetical protein
MARPSRVLQAPARPPAGAASACAGGDGTGRPPAPAGTVALRPPRPPRHRAGRPRPRGHRSGSAALRRHRALPPPFLCGPGSARPALRPAAPSSARGPRSPRALLARLPLRSRREVTPARPGPSFPARGRSRPPVPGPERGFSQGEARGFESSPQAPPRASVPAGTGQPLRGKPRAGPRRHAACILRCPRMAILRPGPRPPAAPGFALT